MSQSPSISIVIRAYNEEKHIGRLLAGVHAQTLAEDLEVILVDSGSTDATIAIARQFPVKLVSIAPEEFTFGRSLNLGLSHCQGEYAVIASAHVYPLYPDWIERLLEPFQDPQVAITYGKQRGNHTTHFAEHQIFAAWFPEASIEVQDHPFCNNANAAIRRSLWEENPYDENLPGLEDVAWAAWAMEAGYAISYVADAEVVHVHDETPRQVYNRYRREAMALKTIRPEERFHFGDFIRLLGTNILSDTWHALRAGVLLQEMVNIVWFRWAQFFGTYRGFAYRGPLTSLLKRSFYYPRSLRDPSKQSMRQIDPIDYGGQSEIPAGAVEGLELDD